MTKRVRLKVEVFRHNEWEEVFGLHLVHKGEKFRVFGQNAKEVAFEAIALREGFLDKKGIGCCFCEYGGDNLHLTVEGSQLFEQWSA